MSSKQRIKLIRNAIASVKTRINNSIANGKMIDTANLYLDLGALEQCYDIEIDMALREQESQGMMERLENVIEFKRAA
jgi:hypothetical protein